MSRKVVVALGVLVLAGASCSGSSGPARPAAKAGQIVTVLRGVPGEKSRTAWFAVAFDHAGTMYSVGTGPERVAKVPKNGTPITIVDSQTRFSPPAHLGNNAGARSILYPTFLDGVAVDSAGTVFIASAESHGVVKVSKSGDRRWAVGDGESGNFAPANGPADQVGLTTPSDLAFDGAGNLFILNGHSVAKLGRDGGVTTVAGTGARGFSGDGGPATAAQLDPHAMTVDRAGTVYIGDNTRVRRVDTQGVIQTIAGTGEAGFSGDGGRALEARFDQISGIAVDGAGNVFVSSGDRVREITAAGIVRTVAGTGERGFSGDGGLATQARLDGPGGLAVDAAGNLYVCDSVNSRVRVVGLASSR